LVATAKSVGKRLKVHVGEPIQHDEHTLILRTMPGKNDVSYFVAVK
jgi:hypothetical protein